MSLDCADFLRLLPAAAEGRRWQAEPRITLFIDQNSRVDITLEPMESLRIGPSLALPRTRQIRVLRRRCRARVALACPL